MRGQRHSARVKISLPLTDDRRMDSAVITPMDHRYMVFHVLLILLTCFPYFELINVGNNPVYVMLIRGFNMLYSR